MRLLPHQDAGITARPLPPARTGISSRAVDLVTGVAGDAQHGYHRVHTEAAPTTTSSLPAAGGGAAGT